MTVIERSIRVDWRLRVFFTEDVFAPANPLLREVLAETAPRRVLVVLEDSLAQAQPDLEDAVTAYFRGHAGNIHLTRPPLFAPGGERAKNSQTIVNDLLSQLHRHHIDRQSAAARCWMWPGSPPPPRTAASAWCASPPRRSARLIPAWA